MLRSHLLPLLPVLATLGCRSTPPAADLVAGVAERYAVERFDALAGLRYTFHARLGDRELARRWEWEPASGRVVATTPGRELEATVYFRGPDGPPESAREVDARFVNDQYWLLFPLHLVRDAGLERIDGGERPAPISGASLRLLTAQYAGEGGYTPGDAYDLYLEPDGTIAEWVYRRGGSEEPTRTAAWAPPVELGPLYATLEFEGPDPTQFRIWFSAVEVRLEGEDTWRAVN